jgi:hypothetical protein
MNWNTVEEKIILDDQSKWDRKELGQRLRLSQDAQLEIAVPGGSPGRFPLSELATTQLCQRLGIPVDYYRRLPGEMKAAVANYDLTRLNGKSYLLRGKGEWIRAFLSGEYVTYNNAQIAETAQKLLEGAEVSVKTFVLEETHLFVKIVSEEIVDEASGLKAGIMVGNSEVGLGSVSVEPFVFRKPCTNDLIVSQEKAFRHPHIHFTASELNRRMAEGISTAFKIASVAMEDFLKSREEPIPNPAETIRTLAAARKLSQKFADQVVSAYLTEAEPTLFGVINAFTHAAQNLAPLQRIEVERFAGGLVRGK